MSNAGHFHGKHSQEAKEAKRPPRFFEDFPAKQIRHADGTHAKYRGGKMVPGTHVKESKHVAKVDVPTPESKFYKATPISTLLEKTSEGEKSGSRDTMGDKEAVAVVRKRFDVNNRSMKL